MEFLNTINWVIVVCSLALLLCNVFLFLIIWKGKKKARFLASITLVVLDVAFVLLLPTISKKSNEVVIEDISASDYYYNTKNDDTIIITHVKNISASDLTIPNTIEGKVVTEIADYAFSGCNAINIDIPSGIDLIGENAFADCNKLININVDKQNNAFTSEHGILFNNKKTKLLCYPIGKQIGEIVNSGVCGTELEWTLYDSGVLWVSGRGKLKGYAKENEQPWARYRNDITSVVFDGYVTVINSRVFKNCSNLKYVILPESVSIIGWVSFENCVSMEEIIIPDSVVTIYGGAFNHCDSLMKISIGQSLRDYDSTAFCECNQLSSISVSDENEYFSAKDNILYDKDFTRLILHADKNSESLVIPNTVTTIGSWSCQGCSFSDVILPDSTVSLQKGSLYNCINLKSITMPKSLSSIGESAFEKTDNLTDITYPGSEQDWEKIVIDKKGNNSVLTATKHFQG